MEVSFFAAFALGLFSVGLIWTAILMILARIHYNSNYSISFRNQSNFFVIIGKLIIARNLNNPRIEFDEKLNLYIWQLRMALMIVAVGIIMRFL